MNNENDILNKLYKLKLFGYKYIDKSTIIKLNNTVLPSNINELHNRIDNCNLCELSNRTKLKITHKNNIQSQLVILVAYSLNDNQYSILRNMLNNYLDIDITNILILNLIKCNINNVNINNKCFDICKDYSIKQLEIINPKYILSFGDIYEYIISDKLKIGQKIRYNNAEMYYFKDLDFILRNPSSIENYTNIFNKIKDDLERE
jgi:DNA polymerase